MKGEVQRQQPPAAKGGASSASSNGRLAFALSLKSVNHRFLDLHFRLPSGTDALEMHVVQGLVLAGEVVKFPPWVEFAIGGDRAQVEASGDSVMEALTGYTALGAPETSDETAVPRRPSTS